MVEGKEEQVISYMDGSRSKERELVDREICDKTIRSGETYSLPQEQYGGNHPPSTIISYLSLLQHGDYGSYNSR